LCSKFERTKYVITLSEMYITDIHIIAYLLNPFNALDDINSMKNN